MRRWGIIVTVFYAVIVFALLLPGAVILAVESNQDVLSAWLEPYGGLYSKNDFLMVPFQIWPFLLVAGQILLIFLSVDTSVRQFKPRRHIMYSAVWTALATMLLVYFAAASLIVAVFGDGSWDWVVNPWTLVWWFGLWAFWGVVFYLYYRRGSLTLERAVSWLLKGSVLELLIAIPAHALVRYREDCSAPIVTGFGIVTGIAIMLMCFGPSVLSLYKKRIEEIESRRRARQRINN
jgi:hypothetical protein